MLSKVTGQTRRLISLIIPYLFTVDHDPKTKSIPSFKTKIYDDSESCWVIPMSYLWGVNSHGKVFVLSTSQQNWQEVQYHGIDFKRVCANEFFTWAIGGDHHIYIYVPTRDIPIRCRVVTYENERWTPFHGFSCKLLPTDRPAWSSADGLTALPQSSFRLPSSSWQWEEEWYVEDNLEGQPLEPEGWTYAIDFPATYNPNKAWNSLVRRRKWVRYRRFCATDKWSMIPCINEDPILDPFIDVTVGGTDIPGGDQNKFSVWAVTITGKVVLRYGVCTVSPEGQGWVPVETPPQADVNQISVGPTGLVWAITWGGNALVRFGVTRENIIGTSWIAVEPPSNEEKLHQISVGTNAVWAVSRSQKVWFRKGIKGLDAGHSEASATGNGWVEMVGQMMMVSVGLNDQVFSISPDGHTVFLRTGVTHAELSGRTWKPLGSTVNHLLRASSLSSLESRSSTSTRKETSTQDDSAFSGSPVSKTYTEGNSEFYRPSAVGHYDETSLSSNLQSDSGLENSIGFTSCNNSSRSSILDSQQETVKNEDVKTSADERSLSSTCSLSESVDIPSNVGWSSAINETDHSIPSLLDECSWVWVSGSGCTVHPDSLPHWFSEGCSFFRSGSDEPWFNDLIEKFKARYYNEVMPFSSYPHAIKKSSWVKSGMCTWFKDCRWVKCLLELEQQGSVHDTERGFLTCHHKNERVMVSLAEITCVVHHLEQIKVILAIHTHKLTSKGKPIRLSFSSDEDLEDWLATLNNTCRLLNSIPWIPEKDSAWSVTSGGNVYVHNPSSHPDSSKVPSKMLWSLLGGGHLRIVETCPAGVTWGIGYNCVAWVYTKGYGGGAYRGISGCNVSVNPMSDVRCLYIYENQRWNPLTGFTAKGLPTDRYMWSDRTGRLECSKENTHLPSSHWQWISDWCIDYKTPGGVDNEGWQYATDFPRSYHAYKSFTDYVRRRRWYRKCRLTTSGPWRRLGTTLLLDISFQIDGETDGESIAVWGVSSNGDVLQRHGVTASCAMGNGWTHVPTEKSFKSISVGSDYAVWAVALDGTVQLRNGIASNNLIGNYWSHVEPPEVGCPVAQISAGKTVVLAVDENNRLWSRQEIVPIYKEGTHWKLVSENVKQVSVGPMDQIWAVMETFETPAGTLSGVVCKRTGITAENAYGTDWEPSIGGNWSYVTVRGCMQI